MHIFIAKALRKPSPLSNGGSFNQYSRLYAPTHGQRTSAMGRGGGFQGTQQVHGSSLPMCFLLNSSYHGSCYRSYCQVPSVLPYASSFSAFQESLQLVRLHGCRNLVMHTTCLLNCSVCNTRFYSNVGTVGADSDVESGGGVKCGVDLVELGRVCRLIDERFVLDRKMEGLEVVLDECEIDLSCELVLLVLERFRYAHKPAFRFFYWAGGRPGFEHDSRTYNKMMDVLGKNKQFQTMVSVIDEMGEKGLLTLETFDICIRTFGAAKERKRAVLMFDLMRKHKFEAGVDTFNHLLDALGKEKLVKEAQVLFDKLGDRFTPNLQTYIVLLNGWCKVKNVMGAGRTWNGMIDSGFKPDIVAHNIMLDGLLRSKKRSEAIKLVEVMKAKGPSPNVKSYTILIEYLCKHRYMDIAIDYVDDMLNSGCEPDAALYTCLVMGFGKENMMDEGFHLIDDMRKKGSPFDIQIYNDLIKLMVNKRKPEPDEAFKVYKRMIQNDVQPTIQTFNMMMNSFFVVKNYEMAYQVWEEIMRRGCCPDENAYSVTIGSLLRLGRSSEACKYFEEMVDKGMRVDQLNVKRLAAAFTESGKPHVFDKLVEKIKFSDS